MVTDIVALLFFASEHGASFTDADMHKTPGSLVPTSWLFSHGSEEEAGFQIYGNHR